MFHVCFRRTKTIYLPLCKRCEVIMQCFPRSPVSAGCYLSKFSLFSKKKVLSFLQQTHTKKQQHNPHHISHCCCVCRTRCLITAVPLDITITTKVPRAGKAALGTSKLQSVHASGGRTHIGWFFWRREEYLKFARTKHRYCPWSLHAVHQVWTCGHAENRGGIHKCGFFFLFFIRESRSKNTRIRFSYFTVRREPSEPKLPFKTVASTVSVRAFYWIFSLNVPLYLCASSMKMVWYEWWSTSPCLILQW